MGKVAQISLLCRVSGNVNADWTIGQRITLKKMQNAEGEVKPFISARAIKYSIRRALQERGHEIDPFQLSQSGKKPRSSDSGDPVKYVDNDLFGFMVATKKEEVASRRQAPIAISYLRSLANVPVSTDLGLRAPRNPEHPPLPFEIEVAEFIGRVDCIVYDYIGVYEGNEKVDGKPVVRGERFINDDKRRKRLRDFLDIFLTPSYVLPRRSNSLVVPEYLAGLLVLSESGPKPVHQYLSYRYDGGSITPDDGLLATLQQRSNGWRGVQIFLLDYHDIQSNRFPRLRPEEAIDKITDFIVGG